MNLKTPWCMFNKCSNCNNRAKISPEESLTLLRRGSCLWGHRGPPTRSPRMQERRTYAAASSWRQCRSGYQICSTPQKSSQSAADLNPAIAATNDKVFNGDLHGRQGVLICNLGLWCNRVLYACTGCLLLELHNSATWCISSVGSPLWETVRNSSIVPT